MKITRLRADNFLRLKSVDIDLKARGNLVQITGRNGAGKSALIRAIEATLGGQKCVPERPVRKGEDKALTSVEIDTPRGTLILTRKYAAGKASTYEVRSADGASYKTPQAIVDGLVDRLTYDPFAFLRLKPAEQLEVLRKQAGLDFSDLQATRDKAYAERTELGRRIKEKEGQLAGLPPRHADAPEALIDSRAILDEIDKANQHNAAINQADFDATQRFNDYERAEEKVDDIKEQIARLQKQLATAKEAAERLRGEYEQAQKRSETLAATRIDTAPLKAKLDTVEIKNTMFRENRERQAVETVLKQIQTSYDERTATISAMDMEKAGRIAEVQLPIEGLDFGEDCVYWRGLPLEQASQSERLRVALAIAAEQHAQLRICLVRDTPMLDDNTLQILTEWADTHDIQTFLEFVADPSEQIGVVIEDGQVYEPETGLGALGLN